MAERDIAGVCGESTLTPLPEPVPLGAWGFELVAVAGWDGTEELRRAAKLT